MKSLIVQPRPDFGGWGGGGGSGRFFSGIRPPHQSMGPIWYYYTKSIIGRRTLYFCKKCLWRQNILILTEGARQNRQFFGKCFQKVPENGNFEVFAKICLLRKKCYQRRIFILFWERLDLRKIKRSTRFSKACLKIQPPLRENLRSTPEFSCSSRFGGG